MDLYLELHVFGAVPVRKKDRILDYKGGSCYGNKILYKNLKFSDKIFVPSKIS